MTAKKIQLTPQPKIDKIMEDGGYTARVILEVVGKPKKHVEDTLQMLIEKISAESARYFLISYSVMEAEAVEQSEDKLFSSFAEVEFAVKQVEDLLNFVLDYTPSSVEVLHPANVTLQSNFFSNMLIELTTRIHMIDGEFRKVVAKNKLLSETLTVMIANASLIFLSSGPKDLSSISKAVGVKEDQLKQLLDKMVAEKRISEGNGKYQLLKQTK